MLHLIPPRSHIFIITPWETHQDPSWLRHSIGRRYHFAVVQSRTCVHFCNPATTAYFRLPVLHQFPEFARNSCPSRCTVLIAQSLQYLILFLNPLDSQPRSAPWSDIERSRRFTGLAGWYPRREIRHDTRFRCVCRRYILLLRCWCSSNNKSCLTLPISSTPPCLLSMDSSGRRILEWSSFSPKIFLTQDLNCKPCTRVRFFAPELPEARQTLI